MIIRWSSGSQVDFDISRFWTWPSQIDLEAARRGDFRFRRAALGISLKREGYRIKPDSHTLKHRPSCATMEQSQGKAEPGHKKSVSPGTPGLVDSNHKVIRRRNKPSLSCEACTLKKTKCERGRPRCLACLKRRSTCVYSELADLIEESHRALGMYSRSSVFPSSPVYPMAWPRFES